MNAEPTFLERIAAGDPLAVDGCLEKYRGLVWSIARRFAGNHADAEDAVQEVFVELWRHAGRFDPAVAAESTFVATVARRRLIDRHRRRGRQPEAVPFVAEPPAAARSEVGPPGDTRRGPARPTDCSNNSGPSSGRCWSCRSIKGCRSRRLQRLPGCRWERSRPTRAEA